MPIRWLILLDFSRSCQNLVSFWLKQLACCCCNTSPLAAMQDECATANAAILKRLGGNTGQVQTRLRVHDVHELANEKSRRMRILMKLKLLKLKSNAMGLKIAKDKAARKKLFVATSRSLMRAKFGKGCSRNLKRAWLSRRRKKQNSRECMNCLSLSIGITSSWSTQAVLSDQAAVLRDHGSHPKVVQLLQSLAMTRSHTFLTNID